MVSHEGSAGARGLSAATDQAAPSRGSQGSGRMLFASKELPDRFVSRHGDIEPWPRRFRIRSTKRSFEPNYSARPLASARDGCEDARNIDDHRGLVA